MELPPPPEIFIEIRPILIPRWLTFEAMKRGAHSSRRRHNDYGIIQRMLGLFWEIVVLEPSYHADGASLVGLTLVPSPGLRIGPACEADLSAGMRRERVPPQTRKKEKER